MPARSDLPPTSSLRLFEVLFILAVPVAVVAAVLWLNRPAEVVTARIIDSTVTSAEGGFVGNVHWIDDGGIRHNRQVEMTPEHITSGTVPLVAEVGGEVTVVDPAEYGRVPLTVLALAAAIGLAFALVVVATMRGFGFVRGTGRPGEMTPDEVQESHAFYWRH